MGAPNLHTAPPGSVEGKDSRLIGIWKYSTGVPACANASSRRSALYDGRRGVHDSCCSGSIVVAPCDVPAGMVTPRKQGSLKLCARHLSFTVMRQLHLGPVIIVLGTVSGCAKIIRQEDKRRGRVDGHASLHLYCTRPQMSHMLKSGALEPNY